MNILLVQPPSRTLHREDVVVPPLGLAYLASALGRERHRVGILDAFAMGMSWGDFESEVKREKADLIGIGGMTPTIDNTLRAARICRPHTRTLVVGGPHLSVRQQEFFRDCPEADFGIVGEGEGAFSALVRNLEEGKDPWEVPGLVGLEKTNPWTRSPFPRATLCRITHTAMPFGRGRRSPP